MKKKIKEKILKLSSSPEFRSTPYFYLYDLKDLETACNKLSKELPKNVFCYYAVKANPHQKILECVSRSKLSGIEIASQGELVKGLKHFKGIKIIYTGPGKTENELKKAITSGVKLLNVESKVESLRINKLATEMGKRVDVLARVNIDFSIKNVSSLMAGEPSKLGVDEEVFLDFVKFLGNLQNVNLVGIHAHLGTGIMDYKDSLKHAEHVFKLSEKLECLGISLPIIDLGGGFGIKYNSEQRNFDIIKYFGGLKKLISKYGYNQKEIILELGRFLVGTCGYYCAEIIDIKWSRGTLFIVTAGGLNHLNRPCVTGENQPIFIIGRGIKDFEEFSLKNSIATISGPLCLNDDFIGKNIPIKRASIGDILVVEMAGAYGLSGSPNDLLSHPRPKEHFM